MKMTNDELMASLKTLLGRERDVMVEVLLHLGEVEARGLHLQLAYSSMHVYCVEALNFSEHQAFERMTAARALRKFGVIADVMRDGALHLSGLAMLAPHLTDGNHEALIAKARFQSKRAIEVIVASMKPEAPKPDRVKPIVPRIKALGPALVEGFMSFAPAAPAPAKAPVEPRFAISFSASQRVKEKLDRARALASHRVPSQQLEAVFELALDALIEKLEKQREGAATKPRPQPTPTPATLHSRTIPRAVRREVHQRDKHQCTFTHDGRRCTERAFLELHHLHAFALGGPTTTQNLTLRCRAHNAYEGERLQL